MIPELVAPLPIPDPFEMCFALLYLSDRDDDIPWLYGACHGTMVAATEYLPWACCDYEERHDKYWNGESNCSDNSSEMPDWYQKILENKASDVILSRMQYVYGMTGCLMPRDLHRYDNEIKVLEEYGLNSDQACGLLYPLLALSNIRRKKTARNLDPAYVAIMRMKETGEYPDFDEKTKEEKEIERLKASIYDLQKALKDTEQKLSEQKESSDAEHRELADLRELLFRGETDEQSETVVDESVFPYEVQKDTVVFGGHETWAKAIKPLIKGSIRFVPKELVFDVSIIRHADIIWVQTNAISHKSYYRIIDVAKKYNKPIRYFQYASAVKCAEQVVMNDKE